MKDNLSKKLTYKESINRYDVEFIYKGKIRLLFMLPTTEKDYAEALLEDKTIRKMMKLFYVFYLIFRKAIFNYVVETQGADFMLEEPVSSNGIRVSFDPNKKTLQACAKTDRSKKLLKRYLDSHRDLVVK